MSTISVDYDVLNQRGSPAWFSDTFANIPTAGFKGRMFISTDTFAFYRDTGTGWDLIGGPGIGTLTGSGVAGQVSFFNGTQVLTGNNNLFWDNVNSRLGINTTTPGAPLDIHATGTNAQFNGTGTSNAYLTFQNAGTSKWRIGNTYNAGANSFDIYIPATNTTPLSISSLGAITLTANVNTTGTQFVGNGLYITYVNGGSLAGNTLIWGKTDGLNFNLGNGTGGASFIFQTAAIYDYTFPATTGTLALTSNLSAYLPLTGGTLTGALVINPTNTLTIGLDVASNTTRFRSDNLEGSKRQLEITMGSGTLVQLTAKGYLANYGTDMAFYTATTGGTNASPGIYITGTNNRVGIKTGTPSYDLSVSGNASVEGTNSGILFDTGTAYTPRIRPTIALSDMQIESVGNGGNVILSSPGVSASLIGFETAGSRKMTINNAGNVLIGTTTDRGAKFVVEATDNNNYIMSYNTTSGQSLRIQSNSSVNYIVSTGANMLDVQVNGSIVMRYVNNGNISIGTTTDFGYKLNLNGQPGANGYTLWTNWSDLRLKENITNFDANNILEKISKLRPVTYNYNELSGFDEETRNRRISGFIAQELKDIFPDMVGTIKKEDIEYYDTNLSNLDLYLVKAIQELYEKLKRNNIN